ncbi:IPT/TIG domain-containing protein [Occallatibacter savannae]|uniref:IPT/TIG domain-containing protein n=1 Tax=Occallatibacter savannae TaxID=1002691 RepID=UPI000D68D02A|nr:IPT/TIG domain-containing protein [Occallatibacter savannae]
MRLSSIILTLLIVLYPAASVAGGPKWVAGTSYFDPAVVGQPLRWSSGVINYYVDQGPLNAQISNQQAAAMVDSAAALWSSVPTAAVFLNNAGPLSEDVSSTNVIPGSLAFGKRTLASPSDVTPAATNYPLAVIYDLDGSVINTLFGAGSSDPTSCQNNGVYAWLDNIRTNATIAHAVILLNGLCATSPNLVAMMQYELARAFGRILGLDYAQVNHLTADSNKPNARFAWPIMDPLSGVCGASGGTCIPDPSHLHYDDMAALNRLYPVTAANLPQFPEKQITAASTISIRGAIAFRTGAGMQGVNVLARPLDANGNPLYEYTVTAVSGAAFSGKRGNPVTGWLDDNDDPLSNWGSNDPALQGSFDISGIPLPPGLTSATYQVSFEPINPLLMLSESVGPYVDGSPAPSGTMPVLTLPNLAAGSSQNLTVTVADSASGNLQDAIATPDAPRSLPPSGLWTGRLGQVGQTDWFAFPVRSGHTFTVVTQALNESGAPTGTKALPVIGIWEGMNPISAPSSGWAPPLNAYATGATWLMVTPSADEIVRLGIADLRGDGRPDYTYNGWVLYADSIQPARLPLSGGPIVIHGMGFRPTDTVRIAGQKATITSISPTEITAIAPPAPANVTGSVEIEVDDLPMFNAAALISGGISYDSGSGDSLTLNNAPSGTVPIGVPIPFTVTALSPALAPAGGVTVTYTVASGNASLGCGSTTCSVVSTGDGIAAMNITAPSAGSSVVIASLTNGASLQAHFTGGTPPTLAALTPMLSVAAGATVDWTAQALALNNGTPAPGQTVAWQTTSAIRTQGPSTATTGPSGIAAKALTVGPLTKGQQTTSSACLNGTTQCVSFTALGARPEFAYVEPVSGTAQSLLASAIPNQITLSVRDMNGNPMAAGSVTLYQALYAWAPPCFGHGRCAQAQLLASQTSTATSTLDGSLSFIPASIPGIPTTLVGLAITGSSSALTVNIEQHP